MTEKDTGVSQSNTKSFNRYSEVFIGGKKYLIERHFTGNRDLKQAVFSAVKNEMKRQNMTKESA